MLGNYKIRVNNEAESKEAQELFFQLGYKWQHYGKNISHEKFPLIYAWKDGFLTVASNEIGNCYNPQLTLTQLRDMVSLESNGANKSTPSYKQVIKYQSEDGMLFDTEQECVNYQNERKLVNILEDNIYALRHEDGGEVLDLIKQHKDLFLDYLNNC